MEGDWIKKPSPIVAGVAAVTETLIKQSGHDTAPKSFSKGLKNTKKFDT